MKLRLHQNTSEILSGPKLFLIENTSSGKQKLQRKDTREGRIQTQYEKRKFTKNTFSRFSLMRKKYCGHVGKF